MEAGRSATGRSQDCVILCKILWKTANFFRGQKRGGRGHHLGTDRADVRQTGPGAYLMDFYCCNSIVQDCGEIICKVEGRFFRTLRFMAIPPMSPAARTPWMGHPKPL